jgi:hypothetical protein
MEDGDKVVVSMGKPEAAVLGMALGLFLSKINFDVSNVMSGAYDREVSGLMESFQMKITAEEMFTSLWTILGMGDDEIASMLEATEMQP